ncbi:MAG: NAD(P)H-binding protein, partial [Halioglobus sp.]
MKSKSVLFVGCGDLGARAGQLLLAQGWQVAGARRDSSRLPAGFSGFDADYAVDGSLEFIARMQPDYVVTTFNPTERSVAGYEAGFHLATANLLAALDAHHPRHIIAVSSTRVFAERDGGWVDESSPLSEEDPRAVAMIRAEQLLLNSGHNASVVRFAGIYGTPGGRLLSRIKTGQLCPAQPPRYGNRIHRDDCARFLTHLLQRADAGAMVQPVYIGVDDRPAPQFEV